MAKHKIFKNLLAYALVAGVVSTTTLPSVVVFAEEGVSLESQVAAKAFATRYTTNGIANFNRGSASISILGNNGDQSLVGKKFNIYKIFNAENSVASESINYTMTTEYSQALKNVVGPKIKKDPSLVTEYEVIDYIQSLNNNKVEGSQAPQTLEGRYSDFRYFVENLRDEIVRLKISCDVVEVNEVKADNSVELQGLDFGYYIVDEVSSIEGTHSAGSLCMVNTANPNASVQVKSDYPSIIKKIKEDDNNTGWNDIGDFEIGQTVPYKFESNVPNMNGYHKYYYAWHDKMDEALTFNKDSVGIKITDATGKSYTLQNSEFKVVENPGNDETFKIEIENLKAIVDTHFNKMDHLNQNIYGQTVELTYNATLNEKAANATGRPGFENDVQLEFSNNPDSDGNGSTGKTPWDTVVCFTYRINGLKINDHDLKLENAKFRLYSDKECKNEVYVKASDKGYIVINRDKLGGTDHTGGTQPQDAVEMVSNTEGVFNIIGLDQGTYYLKETGAPAGYRPILDPIEIVITPTFTQDRDTYVKGEGKTDKTLKSLTATAQIKTFWSGAFNTENQTLKTNVEEGSLNITVINKVGSKLPITGSGATIALIGIGSTLMTSSLVLSRKKKSQA